MHDRDVAQEGSHLLWPVKDIFRDAYQPPAIPRIFYNDLPGIRVKYDCQPCRARVIILDPFTSRLVTLHSKKLNHKLFEIIYTSPFYGLHEVMNRLVARHTVSKVLARNYDHGTYPVPVITTTDYPGHTYMIPENVQVHITNYGSRDSAINALTGYYCPLVKARNIVEANYARWQKFTSRLECGYIVHHLGSQAICDLTKAMPFAFRYKDGAKVVRKRGKGKRK
jgi:hypothetical protein